MMEESMSLSGLASLTARLVCRGTLLVLAIGISPGRVSAAEFQDQEAISPGSPLVDARVVHPGVDTLSLLVVEDGIERPVARMTRSIVPSTVGWTPTWTIIQAYASDRGTRVDSFGRQSPRSGAFAVFVRQP